MNVNLLPDEIHQFFSRFPDFVWNFSVIISAVIIGVLLRIFLRFAFNLYYKFSEFFLARSIVKHLDKPVSFFLPLLMLNFSLPLMHLTEKLFVGLDRAIESALTICFAFILIGAIKVFEDIVYNKYDLTKEDNLKERKIRTQLQFIRKFLIMVIVLVTIAIVLLSFPNMRKVGAGLLTGVGVGGIIIGFAAQQSLGNLLAGFQIAFTQPIRIDDVLVVEGEWGRVEEITLTYVVLRIWDLRRLILPINYFIQTPFQNWTRVSANLLGATYLYLDYSVPVDKLREEFKRLLDANPLWDKKVSALQVTDARESTIEIRFLMGARNSGQAFDLRCYIRENMIAYIQQNFPESLPKTRAVIMDKNKAEIHQTGFPNDL